MSSTPITIRLSDPRKQDLDALLERKNITQTAAFNAMVAWLVNQPDLIQSIVLGQISPESSEQVLLSMLRVVQESKKPQIGKRIVR